MNPVRVGLSISQEYKYSTAKYLNGYEILETLTITRIIGKGKHGAFNTAVGETILWSSTQHQLR